MSGLLLDWGLQAASKQVALAAKIEPLAVGTGVGIRVEALSRRLVDAPATVAARCLGVERREVRRRREEQRDADGLRGRQPAARAGSRRPSGSPAVHWHEGGSGPALLLLNGWMASGLVWPAKWVERLESRFRVIRIDNRGTGWSRTAQWPFTIADMANDARDVLRVCGVDRVTVLGYSMGGLIAQELALRHPVWVTELVLVATTPPTPAQKTPDYSQILSAGSSSEVSELAQKLTEPSFLIGRSAAPGFAEAHPEIMCELLSQMDQRATPVVKAVLQARAMGSWHAPRRLEHLSVPTTIVQGERDLLVPVSNGRRLSSLIPGSRYEELSGVGHLVPQEAGDELLRILGVQLEPIVGPPSGRSTAPAAPSSR